MKITKKLIIFTLLQAAFCAVVPVVFIFIEYGKTSDGVVYKLPLGALLVVLVILIIAKNTLLKPRINKISAAISQHDADLKIEPDPTRIKNLETELKRERTAEVLLNAIIPIVALAAMLVACNAIENAVLYMSGAIGFALLSYAIGTGFGIMAAREVHGKHGGKK